MQGCTRLLEQQQYAALTAAVTIVGCFQLTHDSSLKRINNKTIYETKERVHMGATSLVPITGADSQSHLLQDEPTVVFLDWRHIKAGNPATNSTPAEAQYGCHSPPTSGQ